MSDIKQVTEKIFRGPKVEPFALTAMGINQILNLESGSQVIGDDSPLEEALEAKRVGITVWGHPLGGFFPPSIKELLLAMKFLRSEETIYGNRIYVHCRHGKDRTGMVIAAYRILAQGWSPKKAALEAFEEGMHWVYLPWLVQLWRL